MEGWLVSVASANVRVVDNVQNTILCHALRLPQFTSKYDYPAQEVVDGATAAFSLLSAGSGRINTMGRLYSCTALRGVGLANGSWRRLYNYSGEDYERRPAVYADPSPWACKQLSAKVAAEDSPRQR